MNNKEIVTITKKTARCFLMSEVQSLSFGDFKNTIWTLFQSHITVPRELWTQTLSFPPTPHPQLTVSPLPKKIIQPTIQTKNQQQQQKKKPAGGTWHVLQLAIRNCFRVRGHKSLIVLLFNVTLGAIWHFPYFIHSIQNKGKYQVLQS